MTRQACFWAGHSALGLLKATLLQPVQSSQRMRRGKGYAKSGGNGSNMKEKRFVDEIFVHRPEI